MIPSRLPLYSFVNLHTTKYVFLSHVSLWVRLRLWRDEPCQEQVVQRISEPFHSGPKDLIVTKVLVVQQRLAS